jgi:hypothetical protein
MMSRVSYKLGIFYGIGPETEMLTQKFVGNLINNKQFCKACELLELNVKCDHCREHLPSFANEIYFYEKVGEKVPDFIENPEKFLPKSIPLVDFLLVVGIHQDLLSALPQYSKDNNITAVIIPIENPKWVPSGLQVQVLHNFEKLGIQAAFPKPFCSLSKEINEYNKESINISKNHNLIHDFMEHYKIGEPVLSFLLSPDKKTILDSCILRSAPCGSTYYILQQLKAKYINNGALSLNERVSKAHHSYPCNASMEQDLILKDTILHVGGYLIRNAIRKALGLEIEESSKLIYIIK